MARTLAPLSLAALALSVLALACVRPPVRGLSAAGAEPAALDTVVILHTNDMHGHLTGEDGLYGGVARIAAHVRKQRARHDRVLFLDAGDCIAGTPVSTLFRGQPIFEVMSAMGYDAGALGNHEFDYGWERIEAFREAATFPLLSANARSPEGELIADRAHMVLDLDGVGVAIVGVVSEHTPHMITRNGNENVEFEAVVPLLTSLVPQLRLECEVVILLSHLGSRQDQAVAAAVPGIDVIVGGHDHRLIEEPLVVGRTAIAQAGRWAAHLGELIVVVDRTGKRVRSVEGRVLPLRDLPEPDPVVQHVAMKWEAEVARLVDVRIGVARENWTTAEASAFVERAMRQYAGADFGFYNDGGVRSGFPAGEITARRVWMMLPFGNVLSTVSIRGEDIGGALETALREQGLGIDPARDYVVATNSFVCERPGLFLGKPRKIEISDTLIRDITIEHIRREGLGSRQGGVK